MTQAFPGFGSTPISALLFPFVPMIIPSYTSVVSVAILVVSLATAPTAQAAKPNLRLLTTFPFKKPAFVTAHDNPNKANSLDLLISSFGVAFPGSRNNPDAVSYIADIADALLKKEFLVKAVGGSVVWPNEVNLIDQRHLVVAGGFLVPGKKGHISAMDYVTFRQSNGTAVKWTPLVQETGDGFFHRVEKVNIYNRATPAGQSGERMISCRGHKGVFNQGGGEMVYLELRENGKGFEAKNMAQGCDCFFASVDYNNDGIPEFIVPAFFGKKVFLMWTEHPDGDYSKPEFIRQRGILVVYVCMISFDSH